MEVDSESRSAVQISDSSSDSESDGRAGKRKFVSTAENDYDRVCEKLQLNAIPENLSCRDEEQKKIRDYLRQGIQNKGSSSSLYISGMPGTGKTATTL